MAHVVNILRRTDGSLLRSEAFVEREGAEEYIKGYNSAGPDTTFYAALHGDVITAFSRVAKMNTAFGNPKGDAENIKWDKIRSQCKNIFDEYLELMSGLGLHTENIKSLRLAHKALVTQEDFYSKPDVEAVRDALCDIQVFDMGAQHLMGYDGDRDMEDVVSGVMTRFVKDDADKIATQALHAAKGVTEVYFEGEYPEMVMKSAVDQPDAPKGKFLKSASYVNTVFRAAP
jgi:hypothetical protein